DNILLKYNLKWTEKINWANVVNIKDFKGNDWNERFDNAQKFLSQTGGGVIYFPAGIYKFNESIYLQDGIVFRGEEPEIIKDARDERYKLDTKFDFPQYTFKQEENGTPINTAFKGIYLFNPSKDSNCGVINIEINHGHIYFGEDENHNAGKNRIVYGCVLKNCAVANKIVPTEWQKKWQRYTDGFRAAIHVYTEENALIANNRIPESGEDNFIMKGYVIENPKGEKIEVDLIFDYDNRPGIYVNHYGIGGAGTTPPRGTPELYPHGFRKGIVITQNYIFCTGRTAIGFTGDGTICSYNLIRFKPEVLRWTTASGTKMATGSSTNDNRAVEMRGWRYTVEGNDYLVYRNKIPNTRYYFNDGEGLMHEAHCNSTVLNSKIMNNKGNAYISIYFTGGVNGLIIKENEIRTSGGISAIYVVSNQYRGKKDGKKIWEKFECKNVHIINNITSGSGITLAGEPSENNVIKGNKHIGEQKGQILLGTKAVVEDNENYEIIYEEF
ncbi:MAG: hypothetical protein NZ891_04000, partial [bacterium]|nr:hypothetical protein [bacterium]MDW8163888.1 hypothetical protein [Candidatus Omnitrophota bacterium]